MPGFWLKSLSNQHSQAAVHADATVESWKPGVHWAENEFLGTILPSLDFIGYAQGREKDFESQLN
jgi:hypothetical protein